MSVEIHKDTWIVRRDGLIENFIGEELVGLHLDSGYIFGFNATASRVWQLLEQPRSISSLCSILGEEYAIDLATCEADVRHILNDLLENDLVALS